MVSCRCHPKEFWSFGIDGDRSAERPVSPLAPAEFQGEFKRPEKFCG